MACLEQGDPAPQLIALERVQPPQVHLLLGSTRVQGQAHLVKVDLKMLHLLQVVVAELEHEDDREHDDREDCEEAVGEEVGPGPRAEAELLEFTILMEQLNHNLTVAQAED